MILEHTVKIAAFLCVYCVYISTREVAVLGVIKKHRVHWQNWTYGQEIHCSDAVVAV